MIKLPLNSELPENAKGSSVVDGELRVYFADDPEVIAENLLRAKINKQIETHQKYDTLERQLAVDKNTYKDMQAAALVDIGHRGKNPTDTRKAFKDAVVARQVLQDRSDTLLDQLNNATTVEDVNNIKW